MERKKKITKREKHISSWSFLLLLLQMSHASTHLFVISNERKEPLILSQAEHQLVLSVRHQTGIQ